MRFNGAVALAAPPAAVWSILTNESQLQQLTPNVIAAKVITPQQHYRLNVGLMMGKQKIQKRFDLYWRDMHPPQTLTWDAVARWGDEEIRMVTQMQLAGKDQTTLRFDVDVATLPRGFPPALAHTVVGNALRQFFSNLKRQAALL